MSASPLPSCGARLPRACRFSSPPFDANVEGDWRHLDRRATMRKLIVSEFMTLDGVMQAPGGKDEDRDGGFEHGGWTIPYWHDDIGKTFFELMKDCDALLLGRRTYVIHAEAFEPMPR